LIFDGVNKLNTLLKPYSKFGGIREYSLNTGIISKTPEE
jgi:hypothetical protein